MVGVLPGSLKPHPSPLTHCRPRSKHHRPDKAQHLPKEPESTWSHPTIGAMHATPKETKCWHVSPATGDLQICVHMIVLYVYVCMCAYIYIYIYVCVCVTCQIIMMNFTQKSPKFPSIPGAVEHARCKSCHCPKLEPVRSPR